MFVPTLHPSNEKPLDVEVFITTYYCTTYRIIILSTLASDFVYKNVQHVKRSGIGLVVKSIVAIDGPRVRFSDLADNIFDF